MKPIPIKDMTRDLAKPQGWNETIHGSCGTLPIRDEPHISGNVMLSHWRPSEEELLLLNEGGIVELMVCGSLHPPVSIIAQKDAT